MKVYLGADHRGFEFKNKLYAYLSEHGYEVIDFGAYDYDPKDDYTIYAQKVSLLVSSNPRNKGILICGSGVGVNVMANKFDGIRAGIAKDVNQVKAGRQDDDMNVLVIASDFTEFEEVKKITKTFLETSFSGKARHERRLEDIRRVEENN